MLYFPYTAGPRRICMTCTVSNKIMHWLSFLLLIEGYIYTIIGSYTENSKGSSSVAMRPTCVYAQGKSFIIIFDIERSSGVVYEHVTLEKVVIV